MSTDEICRHCKHPIRIINYASGKTWMHVDPNASFPTVAKGSAWLSCRSVTVAEPVPLDELIAARRSAAGYEKRPDHVAEADALRKQVEG